jgi:hypothetical protein
MSRFDVFLCHNSADKPEVIEIAQKLKAMGLKPWLDIWEIPGGVDWQEVLEDQIAEIKSAAVFIGSNGIGPWHRREIRAFLNEFANRNCPVIPLLLPSAPQKPELPLFLKGIMWVDFRSTNPDPMQKLIWSITGKKPVREATTQHLNKSRLEYYLRQKTGFLEPAEARELEKLLQHPDIDLQSLAQGCLALRTEKGLNIVYYQLDWIMKLAEIADGAIPRKSLPAVQPTGRLASVDWMKKKLSAGLPYSCSCWIALTLGSLGTFIPEMKPPLTYMLFNHSYTYQDRDEALVYLCLIEPLETASLLVEAADRATDENSYLYARALFGLLLIDNVDILALQLLKALPHSHLYEYAYGLAGSRNSRGRIILQQMTNHSNPNIRNAAIEALNKSW